MVFHPDNTDGKYSGLSLLNELSELYLKQKKKFSNKVIVFTNCTGNSFYATYGIPGVYKTLRKSEVLPSELIKMIEILNLPKK